VPVPKRHDVLTRQDEQVCLEERRHVVVLAAPLVRALPLAAAAAGALLLGWPASLAAPVLLAVAAVVVLRAVWRWDRTRLVVTTEKLYVVHGTLRRRSASVRLSRVGAVELEQGLLGRMFGYGTVVAGELEITHVPRARQVCGLLERLAG
jgi:membrane protein YdbS with pleckstrin-like domain